MHKKFLSVLISLFMISMLIPATAFAEELENPAMGETSAITDVELSYNSCTYNGQTRTPGVYVYDEYANLLTKNVDYTVEYPKGRTNAGTYSIVIEGIGDYSGTVTRSFTIRPAKLYSSDVFLSYSKCTYNGSARKPSVDIYGVDGDLLRSGYDYTLSYSSGRTNVGKYYVTVKGKGNYSGSTKKSFSIIPKGTYISSLSPARYAFTAKWNRQSTKMKSSRITGYQLRYSRYSSMYDCHYAKVSGYSSLSKKISNLSGKKRYYVEVRTYKTVNGNTYYSYWSSTKSVVTKAKPSSTTTKMVYIAPYSGTKYHYNKNCRGLRNARYTKRISLSKARSEGYTLCGYEM